jgi:zinc transport system substrate-binding protein
MWHQGENQYDMHVWLDPENARRIVAFVAKELSIIYPRHAFAYKQNALKMIAKIDILDDKLKAHLADFQDKPFIVFHDAYQYFEYAYGLKSIGSITFEPDESSTPSRIREIRARLQESGAKCILQEPQFSSRLTRVIADGTNAKGGILDPLGTEIARGKELYFTLQQNLADNLSQCLSSE